LFGLIGFIPGLLHDYAEVFCLRVFGHIDSHILGYGALIFVLLFQLPILGLIALAVRSRPPSNRNEQTRLESLRKQLLAEGLTPHDLGIWTETDCSRLLARMANVCALLTCLACAVLFWINSQSPMDTRPIRSISLAAHNRLDGGLVRISATARLDWAFRTSEHSYSSGLGGGTTINVFRLDGYGFQPTTRGTRYRDTLFVPLAGADWRPGQPVEVFYQCDDACVFTVPKKSSLLPEDVVVSGRMHRDKLPFFVKRTFQRAGIAVASPYYVLTDREQDPSHQVALTALAGFLVATVLFGLSMPYRLAGKRLANSGTGLRRQTSDD